MKPVHMTKKLTKAQKKAYKPHALPEFPIYRTFPIEKDGRYFYLVGQVSLDEEDHFMQWMVLDDEGTRVDKTTARPIHEIYTTWQWARNLSDSLIPLLEEREQLHPDPEALEQLIRRTAEQLKQRHNEDNPEEMLKFITLFRNKTIREHEILAFLYELKEVVQRTESEGSLSEQNATRILELWEELQEEYQPWIQQIFHIESTTIQQLGIQLRNKNKTVEEKYARSFYLERNYVRSTASSLSSLYGRFDGDWNHLLKWHFEETRIDPENPKPPISFKGKYKPYPVLKKIYQAMVYAIIPLEALIFLGTWNIGVLITIGVQLLVFVPVIRMYWMGATLHLIFQWKEIIADKSMVIASFEADNTGSASAFKTGAILAAVIGGIMYAFSREWPLLLGFLIVAALLYGYGELSARTSLSRTKVDFHEAWIKIGPNEVWSHQIRDLLWEGERTLKIDQGKDKAAFWIQFKPEDKEAAAAALEKWCEKNGQTVNSA
ncbi:MFS transporter [Salibacterium aidingense]|uniref:MFS transporter n=1 Tax=Salibacterium aidingense TaxID=384933 RepID=UPI00040FA028|nr:MFS transporter [Salibacterium aidingense]